MFDVFRDYQLQPMHLNIAFNLLYQIDQFQ